ncbi:MAG: inositol-3-phosphate synthase [Pirellulales bacterium]|nr:inositol-3-phosphate synthase [Pirellulales bacterium]
MAEGSVGLWLIGAKGGVATTVALGLQALRRELADNVGLVSSLPQFAALDLVPWDQIVVGGHDIRSASLYDEAVTLHSNSRVFDERLLKACQVDLQDLESNFRPGTLHNVGPTIENLADADTRQSETPRDAVSRLRDDLEEFRTNHNLRHVVVVNVASTEPPFDVEVPANWEAVEASLAQNECPLPASSLYAIAAFGAKCSYVNFTPSIGSNLPAMCELAELHGQCHAGRDGKTGETLLKSVLAPMFAARHLEVMSWVGHNIFGNMDGVVLNDPANKQAKVASKDKLLAEILGYAPDSLVSIEYIKSLGDWKTAWDHVHFRGFLGTPMTLQFTWQGCDSLLAAPLVLDLVRFTERAGRSGETGVLSHLGSFFKSPMGEGPVEFSQQFQHLTEWAQQTAKASSQNGLSGSAEQNGVVAERNGSHPPQEAKNGA